MRTGLHDSRGDEDAVGAIIVVCVDGRGPHGPIRSANGPVQLRKNGRAEWEGEIGWIRLGGVEGNGWRCGVGGGSERVGMGGRGREEGQMAPYSGGVQGSETGGVYWGGGWEGRRHGLRSGSAGAASKKVQIRGMILPLPANRLADLDKGAEEVHAIRLLRVVEVDVRHRVPA